MLDTKRLLDQFLGTGGASGGLAPRQGRENDLAGMLQGALGGRGLEGLLGGSSGGAGGGLGGMLSGGMGGGLGKGAMAAGLAALLLKGNRKPKKLVGSAVKMGGLALVAGLAYRAYQDYQQTQAGRPAPAAVPLTPPSDPAFLPQDAASEQDRARVILRAMIAAAKADGHIDPEEQTKLFEAVDMLDLDSDDKAFMMDEMRAPLDVAAVVRDVDGVEAGSEVYLASRLVIAEPDAKEAAYLRDLAARLSLPAPLVAQLDAQVQSMEG
ncbi:MAG: tellurite resistance TerB family protein [Pseudomonadota bacterium]